LSKAEALELLRRGQPDAAAKKLQTWLQVNLFDAAGWFLLGACRHANQDLAAAADAFAKCLDCDPTHLEAHVARLTVLRATGDVRGALVAAQKGLKVLPDQPRLYYAIALCLEELGRNDEALAHYDLALRGAPNFEDAYHNRGLLLLRAGRTAEALENQQTSARKFPRSVRTANLLVDTLAAAGELEEALRGLENLQSMAPHDVRTTIRRGIVLAGLLRYEDAHEAFALAQQTDREEVIRFVSEIAPHAQIRYLLSPENLFLWQSWRAFGRCDWTYWNRQTEQLRIFVTHSNWHVEAAASFMALHLPLSGAERHDVARQIATDIESLTPDLEACPSRRPGTVRLGILSPDLREHLNAYLLLPLFEQLDRNRFELVAYSLAARDGSAIRERIEHSALSFRDISRLRDDKAAAAIRADDIDILLDVGGHTTGARFGVTARRPARVQVNYLAFAGSLGSSRVDYAITDRIAGGDADEWTEERVFLPHTYYLYDFRSPVPDVELTRADYGLLEGAFVFCAFHKAEKISPDTFAMWMRILQRVPGSLLWMLSLQDVAQDNLRREAVRQGVDPARLVFAPFDPRDRYLARHRLGDLMLDAIHHSAMTTACDAMAAGLPVLTLRGNAMASRAGESLVRAAGLPDLVALTQDKFIDKAVHLAENPARLLAYRQVLIERKGPLFDTVGRVRELESALLEMWARYLDRTRPA